MPEKAPLSAALAPRARRVLDALAAGDGAPPKRSRALRAAAITFAAGLAAMAVTGALVLTESPLRLERVSAPGVKAVSASGGNLIGRTQESASICQPGEVLPVGTSAVRISIWGFFGARVHVAAYEGSRLLTQGSRGANWTSDSVTVPVRALARSHTDARLCFSIGPNSEPLLLLGARTPRTKHPLVIAEEGTPLAKVMTASTAHRVPARMTIEYLAPGGTSWWSRILAVARHMGLGRFYSGTWIALLAALMMGAAGVLTVRLAIKEMQQ